YKTFYTRLEQDAREAGEISHTTGYGKEHYDEIGSLFRSLDFVAGLEMRFAEGRGPIVSGKCNKVEECEHTPFCDGCKVCSCLETHLWLCSNLLCDANTSDNNVTATTSTLHHTINSSSLAH
ncbi:unnamed protein product, partial [Linum tenue]